MVDTETQLGRLRHLAGARKARQKRPDEVELLQQLIDSVHEQPAPVAPPHRQSRAEPALEPRAASGAAKENVVLDVQLNGQRYTLVRAAPEARELTVRLSARERQIVRLVGKGMPNKAIAAELDVSLWTVATYIRRVFAKLRVKSRAEMVAKALQLPPLDETSHTRAARKSPSPN